MHQEGRSETPQRRQNRRSNGIQERNGSYWVVLRERVAPNAPSKVVWHGPFKNRLDAEAFRDHRRQELKRGTAVEKSQITLSTFLRQWLPDHAVTKSLKRTTVASYEEKIRNYVDPTIGSMALQEIRPHHLKTWTADLLRTGAVRRDGGLSPATVRKVGVIVKEALVAAVEEYGYLSASPAANLKLPMPKRRPATIWSVVEARRFAQAAAHNRLATFYAVLIATGARRGESLALTWDDVDLDTGTITVSKGATWVGGVLEVEGTKTDVSRIVPIDAMTVAALKAHRVQQAHERLACACWKDLNLVFCRPDGSYLPPDFPYRQLLRLIKEADLPRIRLHDLRHTHATWLLEAGEQLHVVAERLGHANSSTTSTIYAHATPKQSREAAETFRRIMDGG